MACSDVDAPYFHCYPGWPRHRGGPRAIPGLLLSWTEAVQGARCGRTVAIVGRFNLCASCYTPYCDPCWPGAGTGRGSLHITAAVPRQNRAPCATSSHIPYPERLWDGTNSWGLFPHHHPPCKCMFVTQLPGVWHQPEVCSHTIPPIPHAPRNRMPHFSSPTPLHPTSIMETSSSFIFVSNNYNYFCTI